MLVEPSNVLQNQIDAESTLLLNHFPGPFLPHKKTVPHDASSGPTQRTVVDGLHVRKAPSHLH